jgi:hypothetical protein
MLSPTDDALDGFEAAPNVVSAPEIAGGDIRARNRPDLGPDRR